MAMDEILRHMPNFHLDPAQPSIHRFGQVIGVDLLPLVVENG